MKNTRKFTEPRWSKTSPPAQCCWASLFRPASEVFPEDGQLKLQAESGLQQRRTCLPGPVNIQTTTENPL